MRLVRTHKRKTAIFLLFTFLFQLVPQDALALTGGPSQPEVEAFQPIGVSDMVDLFSGNFQYNLPLLDVDGYPLNLSYSGDVTPDAEASWVGLGWNLNTGAITRSMRGVPDEFNGKEHVIKQNNILPNRTISLDMGTELEKFGSKKTTVTPNDSTIKGTKITAGLALNYNNYTGFSLSSDLSVSSQVSKFVGGSKTTDNSKSISLTSSNQGLSISPSASFKEINSSKERGETVKQLNIGLNFNSRAGLQGLSFGMKRNRIDASQLGSAINFGLSSYTPIIETPMMNTSLSFTFKTGAEFVGMFPNSSITGTYTWQRLRDKEISVPAFGYLYTDLAGLDGMVDVNRENDGSYNKNTPVMPLPNYTYDVLSVNAQGVSGSFRPFRSEVGNVFDRQNRDITIGVSPGFDIGVGNTSKYGLNISANYSYSHSGKWDDHYNNSAKDHFANNIEYTPGKGPDYEHFAYKQLGEMTSDEEEFIRTKYKGSDPVRIGLKLADITYKTTPSLYDKYGNEFNFPSVNHREHRIKRNQLLSILTRAEVERYGIENYLDKSYGTFGHHPAEITVLKDDGARYVFGIAAYNTRQEETSFSVGRRKNNNEQRARLEMDIDRSSGLVRYDFEDNSMDNDRGLDNFYSNTIMPAFAHSFMLTSILSTDYVDIDGVRGPSKGDIGNYTKFSYTKLNELYKWRVPYEQSKANFNEGLNEDVDDNKANFTYGEKELWYLTKIETKNSVAVFELEDRNDGFGVIDKNGGRGDLTTKLLRKITLYSKPDYEAHISNLANATPIKVVNFEYSYELCPNVPNNNGVTTGPEDNTNKGKLTLKKVYFTYGKSLRGKFSPYTFEYNSGDLNPLYGLKNVDRWGNYKPNSSSFYNSEYPYVNQEKTQADDYSQAWLLNSITLPSGGKIDVQYESDDYAFVQDKRAMQMFTIQGFYRDNDATYNMFNVSSSDYIERDYMMSKSPALINKQYVAFKLKNPIPHTTDDAHDRELLRKEYLEGIDHLYFRIKVDVLNSPNLENEDRAKWEYVSGYCELENTTSEENVYMRSDGSSSTPSDYTHGIIKIKNVFIGDGHVTGLNVHPMSKASWQFGRMSMNNQLYGRVNDNSSQLNKFIKTVMDATFIKPLLQKMQGENGYLMNMNSGKQVKLDHSFIRLFNPDGYKYGGGSRVKKVTISDRWNTMIPSGSSGDESVYGQEYIYTTHDNELNRTISSGVASFEPSVGGDENPFKLPIFHGDRAQKLLAPDDRFYTEGPIGESLFPSPTIGYSKVTVRNLRHSNVNKHATGYVENEFYTAKDFPVIVQKTPIEAKQSNLSPILRVFKRFTRSYSVVTQGFSVELNDMNGKPKAVWVYAEDSKDPISGTEYRYKCQPYQSNPYSGKSYRLNNDVQVVYPDGTIKTKELGVEYDMINDFRQETTVSYNGGMQGNFDVFTAAVVPMMVPTLFNSISNDRRGFRSAVTCKIINRYGIVEEVYAHDLGSKVGTKNLAYDSETGDVLLTQTKNEFEDDIYSMTYPAHWYYNGMGPAYKNYKMRYDGISFDSNGESVFDNATEWFVPGDEIYCGSEKAWVSAVSSTTNKVTFINEVGNPFKPSTTNQTIIILRSGRRNILKANIGSIVSMSNPLSGLRNNSFSKVVNASVQEFKEDWKTYCECFDGQSDFMKISKNPYAVGRKGIWRPFKAYTYLTNRAISIKNNNTDIRHDGTFINFSPFWYHNDGNWSIDNTNWTWTSEITEYSPFGMELENRDPLNRYSAATYGYNNSLPLSVAANAKYTEIGFDGFEDYDFSTCSNDHFSYKMHSGNLNAASSHTGKKSIQVNSSSDVKVSKQIQSCEED